MIEMSQEEFEVEIQRLIDGNITRKKLAKKLQTDMRTLNKKIMEIAQTNSELYSKFVDKFPYKPRKIQVDIEDLAVQVILHGLEETSEATGISTRTIIRKIKTLEKTNLELHRLYTHRNDRMTFEQRELFNAAVQKFQKNYRLEISGIEKREQEIREVLSKFEGLVDSGMSKASAARIMGYDDYSTIWKKYQELKRIETEKASVPESKQDAARIFRSNMKTQITDKSLEVQSLEGTQRENIENGMIEKE